MRPDTGTAAFGGSPFDTTVSPHQFYYPPSSTRGVAKHDVVRRPARLTTPRRTSHTPAIPSGSNTHHRNTSTLPIPWSTNSEAFQALRKAITPSVLGLVVICALAASSSGDTVGKTMPAWPARS